MKLFFLYGLMSLLSLNISAQTYHGFKNAQKDPLSKAPASIEYIYINGSMKAAASEPARYTVSPDLPLPLLENGQLPIKKMIKQDGLPIFIERAVAPEKSMETKPAAERFFSFFKSLPTTRNIQEPENQLSISDIRTDSSGITHVYASQTHNGVPVYGSEISLHLHPDKEVFLGRFYPIEKSLSTSPTINMDAAIALATDDLSGLTIFRELSATEKQLLEYRSPDCRLVIFTETDNQEGNRYVLAYEIEIRPNFIEYWKYFIDAHTGNVLRKFNMTTMNGPATAQGYDLNGVLRNINTYLEDGTYYLLNVAEPMYNATGDEGVVVTYDANNTTTTNLKFNLMTSQSNTWTAKAISAHYNATATYRYLFETFGRNSLNDQGGNIISFINVADDDGTSMDNAFWNGKATFYGNGNTLFKALVGGLDVVAHEMGHGVVSNSANLDYYGQSGAINETYADIFGSMVDRSNWTLGEQVIKTAYFPSGAMRSMSNPHNGGTPDDHYWQPKHVSEMYFGDQDNGGVHINSSIGNHAYYLFATRTSKEKAEQVFYRALTTYLKKTSRFIDFRIAAEQSATDLFGAGSSELLEVQKAFYDVGIFEEEQPDYEQDYQVNPGQDYLLSYDTNPSDPVTLYRSSTTGTNFVEYSSTSMKGKVSVMDDGSYGVFVSGDSRIRSISLDPSNITESILSSDPTWDNVAVSKDGNRIAAITTSVDQAIYVYDFNSERWAKFELYNPTTSHTDQDAGGVLFADAIEFDITGEYLIYDACNVLSSNTTDDIYYWDIGLIRVWNNQSNNFSDGTITKVYGSLPEKVSIGNPVFAKNSPYIIAFDFMDEQTNEYAIFGANLLTGELGLIAQNTILGFPSYSRSDNSVAFSAENNYNEQVVASIGLASDKITGSGSPYIIIPDAKWPVHYSTGIRPLGLAPASNFSADQKSGEAPLEVRFIDVSTNNPTGWNWSFPGGTPSSSNLQNPTVIYYTPGTYAATLTASNSFGNHTNTKAAFIQVGQPTSVSQAELPAVSIFPNPVGDILYISFRDDFLVKLFDIRGVLILQADNARQMDVSMLKSGVYILEVWSGNQRSIQKMVKQ